MPLYVSVPLPGPFRWSRRIGGPRRPRRRASRWRNPWYWLTGIALLELSLWLALLAWGCLYAVALAAFYAGRAAWRHRRR